MTGGRVTKRHDPTTIDNISLRCRRHNQYEAELVFGSRRVDQLPRTSTYERPKRPGLLKLAADPGRGVLVGAVVVGPEAGEWLGQLTLAIRAGVPIDVLRDTIQPYPTFSEAIQFALRDLPL